MSLETTCRHHQTGMADRMGWDGGGGGGGGGVSKKNIGAVCAPDIWVN